MAIIIALLGCLFRYLDVQRRGYLLLSVYFLTHLLSDYYWTVYTLVMHENPDISAFVAYFGWNVGYVVLLVATLHMADPGSKRYFHPLMLVPIPLNIIQFMIYIQYGGIFNNIWSGLFLTAVAMLAIQSIMYYLKTKTAETPRPYMHILILIYVATEYGMWTSSCYAWPGDFANPYYYSEFLNYVSMMLMPFAAGYHYRMKGLVRPEKSAEEMKFQVRIQGIVSFIIFGVCAGGYYLAKWMKSALPTQDAGPEVYSIIAVMLFVLSLFLVLLILAVLYVIALRYKSTKEVKQRTVDNRRNRFNLVLTLAITLALMIFSVVYNSRLYYNVSVSRIYDGGEEKAETTAKDLENYLTLAQSTLKVSADTVDLMVQNGQPRDNINGYLVRETENQSLEFDENFTGIYAYVQGDYMDGSGWEPPEGYDPTTRSWYKDAVAAEGRTVLVSPYIDAQTHAVVMTISKMLSGIAPNGDPDVVALDVIVNYVQEVTEQVDIDGKGYAMVVNEDGMIISHHDPSKNGQYANASDVFGREIFERLLSTGRGNIDATIGGEECTLFVSPVLEQWYVVIVVNRTELLQEVRSQMIINVIVSFVIFALISVFYYLGYKNEQAYGKKVEEMRIGRQKQEYEAEVLRLEKHAADEANKAKSSFLADMSHEIRTPINAILGMNEMILRETDKTEVLEYSRNIKSSGRNLLQLINSILDFSKIEDGKMEIVPIRYSLSTLITYLINSVEERARAKELEFKVDVDPNLPSELYGDDSRIEQVIVNLLTNAVKYTPQGSVTLRIREKERTNDSVLLNVEVADTGIGIKQEDMEKLFESFERLDVTRNRNIEGTGLGISIVTKLLALMDSELKVESEYEKGSVFSFDLLQKIENPEPLGNYRMPTMHNEDLHSYHETFRAPDARILIVDDTRMNIMVAVNLLKMTDVQIDTSENGQEAVRLCEKNAYDVILLDQRMPGMDGTETLQAIRALEDKKNASTPVICLTADAVRGARERYLSQGFSDYLTKPVEGHDLERMLMKYIPEYKIERVNREDLKKANSEGQNEEGFVEALKKAGFDTDTGLHFCQQDPEIYKSILSEFAGEWERKSTSLKRYYDNRNWDDYMILIHSVKSSAKTIGASNLSEKAAALEKASKEKDADFVKNNHDEAMKLYEEVMRAITRNIEVKSRTDSDDDVLEFDPVS